MQYQRGQNSVSYDRTSLDAFPLDFSYKELKSLSDIKYKDARNYTQKAEPRKPKLEVEVKDDKKNQHSKQEEEKAIKKDQNNDEEEEDEENIDQEEDDNEKENNEKEKQDDKKKQEVSGPEVIRAIPSTNIKDVITSHGVQMSLMAQKSQGGGKNQSNTNNLIQKKVFKVKKIQTTLLLGYNQIPNIDNFFSIVDAVMLDCKQLRWVDLSHNHLVNVTCDFAEFPALTILYLHCNYLYQLKDLLILEKVPLRELTIHGNPIDTIPNFRLYIIGILPQLKKLDTVLISKKERDNCRVWIECFKLVNLPFVKDPVKPESQLNTLLEQSQI